MQEHCVTSGWSCIGLGVLIICYNCHVGYYLQSANMLQNLKILSEEVDYV